MDQDQMDHYLMQKDLQQQQADSQTTLYAPQLQEQIAQNQAVVIAETDPRKDIMDLIREFRGLEEINGEYKQTRDSIMNEKGINRITQILRPMMINTIRFTRLREKMINNFTKQILNDLTTDLGLNWREYGIKDRSACDHVVDSVAVLIFSMLSRSEDQNEKNWIGKISFENVSPQTHLNRPKKESWIDRFKL